MKALVLTQYKHLEIQSMPDPEIGPGDVLVEVKACGICGSDVHGYDGSTGRRIPPLVMGHEAAGVVARVGAGVKSVAVGDRVTFDSTVYCGACYFCRQGRVNLCDNRRVLGVSCGDYRRHGAFAQFVAVPEYIVYKIPANMTYEQAAMIEPVSVAVHAVNRTRVRMGDTAVVVGAGMIGLFVVQALRHAGCGRIIAVDLDAGRLDLARKLGADEGLIANQCDVVKEVLARTEGRGADIATEVVGAAGPLNTAIACLRKGGSLTLVGNLSPKVELPLQVIVTRELNLSGSCASSGEYPACIDLIARGAITVDPFMSASAPMEEGPGWFDRLYNKEPGLMKVLLRP
jgi:L-iditol 2-dehydrogenase